MKKFLYNYGLTLIWVILTLIVFFPVLGQYTVLISPDSPAQPISDKVSFLNDFLSGTLSLAPHDLYRFLPPHISCDLTYILDTIIIAIGFTYFLRTRSISPNAAVFAGGAFAFMGYSFTLFSAGHRGFFFMTAYTVFLFAFISRAVSAATTFKRILYFSLAAFMATWMIRYQPDFAIVYLALAVIYTIFLIAQKVISLKKADAPLLPAYKSLGISLAIAAIAFAVAAFPTIHTTLTSTLQHRQKQIAESTPTSDNSARNESEPPNLNSQLSTLNSADNSELRTPNSELTKWIFATNWSLPPSETIELIAPAIKGRQSGDPKSPYWGELGRSIDFPDNPQSFFNFRQHVVYLGVIPVSLAILALCSIFLKRNEEEIKAELISETGNTENTETKKSEIIFWSVIAIIALLLAYGRHTPFYKLFYSLPYMSYLRAPVKFIRIVEFAVCVLSAYGLAYILSNAKAKALRIYSYVLGGLAVIILFAAIIIGSDPEVYCSSLKDIGAASLMPEMAKQASNALLHTVVGLIVLAAVIIAASVLKLKEIVVSGILCIAVAIDVALVVRPFINKIDVAHKYNASANPIVKSTIESDSFAPCATMLTTGKREADAKLKQSLADAFGANNIGFALYINSQQSLNDYQSFVSACQNELRIIELQGASHLLVEAGLLNYIPRQDFKFISAAQPTTSPNLIALTKNLNQNGYALFEVKNRQPFAKFYGHIKIADKGRPHISEVARIMGNDYTTLAVSSDFPQSVYARINPTEAKIATVKPISNQNRNGALSTVIETSSRHMLPLYIRRGYNPDNVVKIDGQRVEHYKAGYNHTVVIVPAGNHTITINSKEHNKVIAATSAAAFILFLALLFVTLRKDEENNG